MNVILKSFLIWMVVTVSSIGSLPENPFEYAEWQTESLAAIESQATIAPELAIPKLGSWVHKLSIGVNVEKNDRPVFHAAQAILLSIPGHATYYQDKLESMRAEVLANAIKPFKEIERMRLDGKVIELGDYEDFRKQAFDVLGLLPSSESVAVLGHFLNDPESRDGRYLTGEVIKFTDYQHYPPNCAAAYIAIANLGIEKPPGGAKPSRRWYDYNLDEVDAWKDWWNEIKDGKRTYRFIGSAIEYGPDGPASSEVIQRAQRHLKRDAERSAGHKKATAITEPASEITRISKPFSIAWIIAACALVAGAGWYFLQRRKAL